MLKRSLFVIIPLCISILLLSFIDKKNESSPKATIKTLIIDPGHGGNFPGAHGLMSYEKDISLQVALKFGKALHDQFPTLKIVYTRTTDANAGGAKSLREDLNYRADIANSSNGDLFISIHCNSNGKSAGGWYERVVTGKTPYTKTVGKGKKKKKVTAYRYTYENVYRKNLTRGTETYIWAVSKNSDKVNSVALKNESSGEIDSTGEMEDIVLPDPSDPTEKARMLIYAQQYFRKSRELAEMVEKEFIATGRSSRGVLQRNNKGIWVLQATGMPSILVEIGFITNKEEEEYLNSDDGQAEIVNNLVGAFSAYKLKTESKAINNP